MALPMVMSESVLVGDRQMIGVSVVEVETGHAVFETADEEMGQELSEVMGQAMAERVEEDLGELLRDDDVSIVSDSCVETKGLSESARDDEKIMLSLPGATAPVEDKTALVLYAPIAPQGKRKLLVQATVRCLARVIYESSKSVNIFQFGNELGIVLRDYEAIAAVPSLTMVEAREAMCKVTVRILVDGCAKVAVPLSHWTLFQAALPLACRRRLYFAPSGPTSTIELVATRKLFLILDLDRTVALNSDDIAGEPFSPPTFTIKLKSGKLLSCWVRPGLRDFIRRVAKSYHIVAFSAGTLEYTVLIVDNLHAIDPIYTTITGAYSAHSYIDPAAPRGWKNAAGFMSKEQPDVAYPRMVVIVDDNADLAYDSIALDGHLYKVPPQNTSSTAAEMDVVAADLIEIHSRVYTEFDRFMSRTSSSSLQAIRAALRSFGVRQAVKDIKNQREARSAPMLLSPRNTLRSLIRSASALFESNPKQAKKQLRQASYLLD